jgi:hypothetical protein
LPGINSHLSGFFKPHNPVWFPVLSNKSNRGSRYLFIDTEVFYITKIQKYSYLSKTLVDDTLLLPARQAILITWVVSVREGAGEQALTIIYLMDLSS